MCKKVLIHSNNRVMDAVVGVGKYFLEMSEDPFSDDSDHMFYFILQKNILLYSFIIEENIWPIQQQTTVTWRRSYFKLA